MLTFLRRAFLLALVAGAGYIAYTAWQRRRDLETVVPEWPPLETPPLEAPAPSAPTVPSWVEPDGGACPASHPIKANDKSGIFHQPGGRFYERTSAERCYADPAAAEADGYRASKS